MILDITKLTKEQLGNALVFEYPLTFNDKEQFANIVIEGAGTDRQIQVYLSATSILRDFMNAVPLNEVLETNDIKIAWEKFEDLFNSSDEGKAQNPEEPEVTNLFLTFDATGSAKLFLQNLQNEQNVVLEFTIDDLELKSKRPNAYVLDYTNDTNMPEQLRAKWFMANTNGDVKLEGTNSNYSTYQVAVVSIAPPNGGTPPPPNGGTPPPPNGGTPPPPNGDTPQHSGTGKDEQDTISNDFKNSTYSQIIETIANVSGYSQSKVMASLRDEDNFRDFIEINDVNWKDIATQTGLSNDFYEFTSQVINIVENN